MTDIVTKNPILYSDFPDPDIIRVGDEYFMTTTTMHLTPGCDILRSPDLVHWQFAAHAFEALEDTADERLENPGKNAYGQGMWAPSLNYHDGTFYVTFTANDTHKTYLLQSEDPAGPWRKSTIEGFYHDNGLLFDDDGRVYIVYGNMTLHLTELTADLRGPLPGGLDRVIAVDDPHAGLGYEGSHLYKINGRYYVMSCHFPANHRKTEACMMADSLHDDFVIREVLDDDLGFRGFGVAQGGMVDTPDGRWYGFMMQDRGAVGRVLTLMPMRFGVDGFPVFGDNGRIEQQVRVPQVLRATKVGALNGNRFTRSAISGASDDPSVLEPYWQFNHIAHAGLWRVDPRDDSFHLRSGRISDNINHAWNTLTQRTVGPKTVAEVTLDGSSLHEGDIAGLAAFQGCYSYIALTADAQGRYRLVVDYKPAKNDSIFSDNDWDETAHRDCALNINVPVVRLRAVYDFTDCADVVSFSYRPVECDHDDAWIPLGAPHRLYYKMDHFTGCRVGMFLYSSTSIGGEAAFSRFTTETHS